LDDAGADEGGVAREMELAVDAEGKESVDNPEGCL